MRWEGTDRIPTSKDEEAARERNYNPAESPKFQLFRMLAREIRVMESWKRGNG